MARERVSARLYVEQDLAAGQAVGLDRAQAHYLRSVLRLSQGAKLAIFNGRDGEWLARLEALGKGWASLVVEAQRREQKVEPDLWLVFAPIKRARLDYMVEKASELGCSRLIPVMTRFTDVTRVNTERLAANAREAAEQCERLTLPIVEEPESLSRLLETWPAERRLLVCAESGAAAPIAEVLASLDAAEARKPWAILVGPEGGFHEEEHASLARMTGVTRVSLGPRILRAETAALAALVAWQACLGDWRERPPFREAAEAEGAEDSR